MRLRQKQAAAKKVADYMIEAGGLMTEEEYRELESAPLRIVELRSFFNTWGRMWNFIKEACPEEYEKIEALTPKEESAASKMAQAALAAVKRKDEEIN